MRRKRTRPFYCRAGFPKPGIQRQREGPYPDRKPETAIDPAQTPQAYFHVIEGGRTIPDSEGMEVVEVSKIEKEALRAALEMAAASRRAGLVVVQVADEQGRLDAVAEVTANVHRVGE